MSQNVYPQQPIEVVHCSAGVLIKELAKPLTPEQAEALSKSQKETAHRRPNPANGAPKPKNHNPVA